MQPPASASLELGVIGNCTLAALVDGQARINWCCFPRFDGDPAFCALLQPNAGGGDWAFELEDFEHADQHYEGNTAILITRLHDRHGGCIEITDFAPRYEEHGRLYHPTTLMRQVRPLGGTRGSACACIPSDGMARKYPNARVAATMCVTCSTGSRCA